MKKGITSSDYLCEAMERFLEETKGCINVRWQVIEQGSRWIVVFTYEEQYTI